MVLVVDAATGAPLENVEVSIGMSQRTGTGEEAGKATFAIETQTLYVKAHLDGYNDETRVFNRVEMCANPREKCVMSIALGRTLSDGEVATEDDGCYIYTNDIGTHEMQATLEWLEPEKAEDLDLWVGALDCRTDLEKRYNCQRGQRAL